MRELCGIVLLGERLSTWTAVDTSFGSSSCASQVIHTAHMPIMHCTNVSLAPRQSLNSYHTRSIISLLDSQSYVWTLISSNYDYFHRPDHCSDCWVLNPMYQLLCFFHQADWNWFKLKDLAPTADSLYSSHHLEMQTAFNYWWHVLQLISMNGWHGKNY